MGTSLDLKTRFGVGYTLTVSRSSAGGRGDGAAGGAAAAGEDGFEAAGEAAGDAAGDAGPAAGVEGLTQLVQAHVPEAQLLSVTGGPEARQGFRSALGSGLGSGGARLDGGGGSAGGSSAPCLAPLLPHTCAARPSLEATEGPPPLCVFTTVCIHHCVPSPTPSLTPPAPLCPPTRTAGSEAAYRLTKEAAHAFPSLLRALQAAGQASYGLSETTLEDVFLRVSEAAEAGSGGAAGSGGGGGGGATGDALAAAGGAAATAGGAAAAAHVGGAAAGTQEGGKPPPPPQQQRPPDDRSEFVVVNLPRRCYLTVSVRCSNKQSINQSNQSIDQSNQTVCQSVTCQVCGEPAEVVDPPRRCHLTVGWMHGIAVHARPSACASSTCSGSSPHHVASPPATPAGLEAVAPAAARPAGQAGAVRGARRRRHRGAGGGPGGAGAAGAAGGARLHCLPPPTSAPAGQVRRATEPLPPTLLPRNVAAAAWDACWSAAGCTCPLATPAEPARSRLPSMPARSPPSCLHRRPTALSGNPPAFGAADGLRSGNASAQLQAFLAGYPAAQASRA